MFDGAERELEQSHENGQVQRNNEQQTLGGSLLILELAAVLGKISGGKFDLFVDFGKMPEQRGHS